MNVRRGLPAVGLAVILATGPAALVLFGPTLSQAGAAVPADDPVTETVTTTVTETPPPVTETATVTATETTTATETDTATATNTTTSTATTTAHSTSTVRSTATRMLPGATSYRTLPGGTVVRAVVVRTVVTPSVGPPVTITSTVTSADSPFATSDAIDSVASTDGGVSLWIWLTAGALLVAAILSSLTYLFVVNHDGKHTD